MLPGPIERFLTEDHVRLDDLLQQADPGDGEFDPAAFGAFRKGLLRHIAMEEKVLLRYARDRRGGQPLPLAAALRRDHGAIARLLARPGSSRTCAELRDLLGRHNSIEEGPDGLYATCDRLAGSEAEGVVRQLMEVPEVPVSHLLETRS